MRWKIIDMKPQYKAKGKKIIEAKGPDKDQVVAIVTDEYHAQWVADVLSIGYAACSVSTETEL